MGRSGHHQFRCPWNCSVDRSLGRLMTRTLSERLNQMLKRMLALVLALLGSSLTARAQVDFTSTVAFGDSLTDNSPFQPLGGADPVETLFRQAAATGSNLSVQARSGARLLDVNLQFLNYVVEVQNGVINAPGTLFSYEIGTNDLVAFEATLKVAPPATNPAGVQLVDGLLQGMANQLSALSQVHPNAKFIVWTVPDVTTMPGGLTFWSAAERANIRAFVDRVNAAIRPLNANPNVLVFDFEFGLTSLILNPPTLGMTTLLNTPGFGTPRHLFADSVHPTAVTNGMLANWLIANVNLKWGTTIPLLSIAQLRGLCGC